MKELNSCLFRVCGCLEEPDPPGEVTHQREGNLKADAQSSTGFQSGGGHWKLGQEYPGRETVSPQNEKVFHVLMCGGCQGGYMRMNGDLEAAL